MPKFPVVFDDDWFARDLAGATADARTVAERARAEFESGGVDVTDLKLCQAVGSDGTRLPNCVKVYLGTQKSGGHPWGMVFLPVRTDVGPRLRFLAFGVRHPPPTSIRPSVYERAHRRLHADP